MYFIDLSMRNPEVGYVDSIGLIANASLIANGVGTPKLNSLYVEAVGIVESDYCDMPVVDAMMALEGILSEAEWIAADIGFDAFPHEGYYYVMTEAESEEWWATHEV